MRLIGRICFMLTLATIVAATRGYSKDPRHLPLGWLFRDSTRLCLEVSPHRNLKHGQKIEAVIHVIPHDDWKITTLNPPMGISIWDDCECSCPFRVQLPDSLS